MISIQLDPEIERRLSEFARRTGQSPEVCARGLIEENIDDLEERRVAELRLKERQPSLTSHQMRKQLGLKY